jgi:hypothetical protein
MNQSVPRDPFDDAPVIFQYTRAQAIVDGALIDLTQWAKETGFRVPVACTSAVWNGYLVPTERTRELGQSERGRAHDLLWMLFCAIRSNGKSDTVLFDVMFLQTPDRRILVRLKSVCGPGDRGEPAVTVMLPGED